MWTGYHITLSCHTACAAQKYQKYSYEAAFKGRGFTNPPKMQHENLAFPKIQLKNFRDEEIKKQNRLSVSPFNVTC
jgi:hypothetical protein